MPIELQVIRASEFIRLDARAHLDLEQSKEVLKALVHACRKRGVDQAMLDLRALPQLPKPRFTANELATLVSTFRDAGFTHQQRLAILYHSDLYGGVRTFAFISRMRGLSVQAFTDFEHALEWLSQERNSRTAADEGEVSIPVVQRRPKPHKAILRSTAIAPRRSTAPAHARRTNHRS